MVTGEADKLLQRDSPMPRGKLLSRASTDVPSLCLATLDLENWECWSLVT